ncbi:MAG: polyamine ABC transporter ATP-binding protein [Gammaproteobacteria bacterium]|nr:polyamine ABC transporter ATP-binding protein [Gammaproteobacteria bacterium]
MSEGKKPDPLMVAPWKDPAATPYIRIQNVTKKFGDFVAVNNVSLNIYKQELFCLLGGSGCGKSTLLRMLAGFEEPDGGQIFLDGQDMAGIAPYKRPVNMMFQSYALFPHMNVEDNVAFGLKQDHTPKKELWDRVKGMLEMVKLSGFASRKPHQLSGGQRQRVALARALVKQPKLLLLDEPLGALDRKLRESTQFELMNIQEKLGVTFVVVTHDQEEAMTLASRIGVMNLGQIVQVGTPTEIYEFPTSRFVADFVGSVNMFDGRITDEDNDYVRISSEDAGCTIFINHGVAAPPSAALAVAIRPEKIAISRSPPANTQENCTQGIVEDIAYMGDMSVFNVRLKSGKLAKVTQPNLVRHTDDAIHWDDHVFMSWHAASGVVLTV